MLYKVELAYMELLLVDGLCNEEAQKVVDKAKQHETTRLALENAPDNVKDFCALLVTEAMEKGILKYSRRSLRSCQMCKKQAGYATYSRSSRYHSKGEKNYEKPLAFYAYDFKDSFVFVQGYSSLGICPECWEILKPALLVALKDIKVEISESITGEKPRYKKVDIWHCKKCDWKGLETAMGRDRTLMGDGYYPSTCPSCAAKNLMFGTTYLVSTGAWECVEAIEGVTK